MMQKRTAFPLPEKDSSFVSDQRYRLQSGCLCCHTLTQGDKLFLLLFHMTAQRNGAQMGQRFAQCTAARVYQHALAEHPHHIVLQRDLAAALQVSSKNFFICQQVSA